MAEWTRRAFVAVCGMVVLPTMSACGGEEPVAPPEGDTDAPTSPGTWSGAAPLPEGVSHAGVAVVDGRIHVVGGWGADGAEPSARVYRYDPATNAWARFADLPEAVLSPAAAGFGGTLYVMGGNASRTGISARTGVWTLDLDGEEWTLHSALPIPSATPVAAVTEAGLHAAALGTFTVPPGDSTALLPPGGIRWQGSVPQPFAPRWLLSDGSGAWAVATSGLSRLDAVAGTWSPGVALPAEGFLMGAWLLDGRVHVLQRLGTRATLRAFDPETGTWETLASPTEDVQRTDAMSVELGGRLYLIGGRVASPEGAAMRRVDVFTPSG